jgi:hypothetical protein
MRFPAKPTPPYLHHPELLRWDPDRPYTLFYTNDLEVPRFPLSVETLPAVRMPSVAASCATQGGTVSSGTHGFGGGNIASQVGNVTGDNGCRCAAPSSPLIRVSPAENVSRKGRTPRPGHAFFGLMEQQFTYARFCSGDDHRR